MIFKVLIQCYCLYFFILFSIAQKNYKEYILVFTIHFYLKSLQHNNLNLFQHEISIRRSNKLEFTQNLFIQFSRSILKDCNKCYTLTFALYMIIQLRQ